MAGKINTLEFLRVVILKYLQVNRCEGEELTEYGREGKGEGEKRKVVTQAMAHHHLKVEIEQFRVQFRFRPFRNCLNPELNHQFSSGQHLNLNLN
jgi:hypothetical protein